MPLKKIVLIANPGAGRKDPAGIGNSVDLLKKHVDTVLVKTQYPGQATELARTHGKDPDTLIAVCGGDGTVSEALNGLPPGGVMGILPGGTANVIARELGIPLDLRESAKVLLTGAIREVDTGWVETKAPEMKKRFLMVAGFGFDAHVASMVSPFLKRILRQYAYHFEVFKQFLSYRFPQIKIRIDDGKTFFGDFALLANMRRYGGDLFFASDARYDDGLLDMVLFRKSSFRTLFRGAFEAWLRNGVPEDISFRERGRSFRLSFDSPTPFQVDGEVFPAVKEALVTVHAEKVRLVTP